MEQICPTPNTGIKTIEINESGNRYKCHIQTIKDFIQISLFINDNNKQEGRIHLSQIQNQIFTFMSYNINEIFENINLLNERSFSLIKKEDKYILKIEFIILRKKQYLEIELIPNNNINNNDLIQTINELKQIIQEKDNEINNLIVLSPEPETNTPDFNRIKLYTQPLCSLIVKSGLNVLLLYITIELS